MPYLKLDHIDDNSEVIVNYCDYFMTWDYVDFKQHIQNKKPAGALSATLFIHLLHSQMSCRMSNK